MSTTSDPDDPRLTHGADTEPAPMAPVYLVLSEEERAKGFVRPLRRSYRHTGLPGPRYLLRDVTPEEHELHSGHYVKFEPYPEAEYPLTGRYWTQDKLDAADAGGCGTVTRMGLEIAETYARNPGFYGATYCCGCRMHLPVGARGEFTWIEPDGSEQGNLVGT